MADDSVPRKRHDFDSHIPQKLKDEYCRHLDRYLPRIWTDPDFLRWRQAFAETQAHLRQLRDTADPLFLTRYWRIMAGLIGIGGYDSVRTVPTPVQLGGRDEDFERDVDTILMRLGLFSGRDDNLQYRQLIAHLVLWPDEIDEAGRIRESFPYPFFVTPNVQDGKQVGRCRLTTEPDITDKLRSAAGRIQKAFDDHYRRAPPLPHGSSPEAIDRRAQKREARLRAGKIAYELNERHHTTLGGILANQAFQEALREYQAFHDPLDDADLSMSSPSAVSKLISEYKKAEGLGTRPRGRPRQD
jgi:hypothetical protein